MSAQRHDVSTVIHVPHDALSPDVSVIVRVIWRDGMTFVDVQAALTASLADVAGQLIDQGLRPDGSERLDGR